MLLISYFSAYVSPASAWLFAFFSLTYPFLLILNILFLLFWIVFRKWYFLISLLCIAAGWASLRSTFQINFKKPASAENHPTIRLLTYNVRLFNYYQWTKDTMAWQRIMDYIQEMNPDIVCFQEFITLPRTPYDIGNLLKRMKKLSYSHVYYTNQIPGHINFGIATFSKYPIVNKKMIDFSESLNGSISSDIVVNGDTIRIINCHLQSIRLRKQYSELIDSLIFNYSERQLDELKDVSTRMKQAFILRANQVDILSDEINSSPYPVIICGDFNDTPVSYTYRTLSKDMRDAFVESGSGTGTTFRGNFPYVRIDYVLFSPGFTSLYYNTDKVDWSDHYPVIAGFMLTGRGASSGRHSRPKE